MLRILLITVCVLVSSVCEVAQAQTWPNQPSGSTTIVDCNFNSMLCGYNGTAGGGSIVSDSTAPLSPLNVVEFRLNVGQSNGGGEVIYSAVTDSYYLGFWWKPSNPFEGHPNCSNKVAGMFTTDGNLLLDMLCTQSTPGGPYTLGLVLEIPYNNCHLNGYGDCPGTFNLFPNRGGGDIALGVWHRVELYMEKGSSGTGLDATIRMWVDGQIRMDYTNVNMPGSFTDIYFTPTWDGSWMPVHTSPMSHRYDHVHISVPSGNGDTTPPTQVTNLAAQVQSSSQIGLTWTAATDTQDPTLDYSVEYCTGASCTSGFQLFTSTQNTATTVTGLTANTTYGFRVRAVDNAGNLGAYSSIVYATTQPSTGGNTILSLTNNGLFAINGVPTFLLGISYYDGSHYHTSDIDSLATRGFKAIVVHCDDIFRVNANSCFNSDGTLKSAKQTALEALIDYASTKGMIVDLQIMYADLEGTNSAAYLTAKTARLAAVTNAVAAFKANTNVMFGVVNEHNLGRDFDAHDSNEMGDYMLAARTECPACIIYYSSTDTSGAVAGDGLSHIFTTQSGSTVNATNVNAELADGVNALVPHNNRSSGWELQTTARATNLRAYLDSIGRQSTPVYFNEDGREGSGGLGNANAYITVAQDCKRARCAGWVFHTQAGFDLDPSTMFSQFTAVENSVVDNIGAALSSIGNETRDTATWTEACTGTAADLGASWDDSYAGHTTLKKVSDRCQPTSTVTESLETNSTTLPNNQWSEWTFPTFTLGGTYTEARIVLQAPSPSSGGTIGAPVQTQSVASGSGASPTITFGSATTTGNALILCIFWKGDVTITSISGHGTWEDMGPGRVTRPTDGYAQCQGAPNITGSSGAITINFSGAPTASTISMIGAEYSGVHTTDMFDSVSCTGTATSGTTVGCSSSITPTITSGALVGYSVADDTTAVAGSGYSTALSVDSTILQYRIFTTAQSPTTPSASFATSMTKGVILMGVLKAASSTANNWYECRFTKQTSGTTVSITRKDNNVPTTLAGPLTTTLNAGGTGACERVGSSVRLLWNGTTLLSATDTAYNSGRAGLYLWSDNATTDIEADNGSAGGFTTTTYVEPVITDATVTATGATITYTGSLAFVRVLTDLGSVIEPLSAFPGGVYTRQWVTGETFVCFFARDINQVENTDPADYQCRPTVIASDTTPPVISSPFPSGTLPAGTTSALLGITTNENATCRYGTTDAAYASLAAQFSTTGGTAHTVTVTGLSNGNTYTYYTRCLDNSGNANTSSFPITFQVAASGGDTTPPGTVTNFAAVIVSGTQLLLTWTPPSDPDISFYRVFRCVSSTSCTSATIVLQPTGQPATLSGLSPGQIIYLSVKAVDTSLNTSTNFSNIVSVTMPSGGDTLPPPAPTHLRATGQAYAKVQLSWSRVPDESGIAGYFVERCTGSTCTDFLGIIFTKNRRYEDTNVTVGQTYRYRVSPMDLVGNIGAYTSIVTVTVPATPASTRDTGVGHCQGCDIIQ